jgi:tRNA A37 methylthiotransferase MiaB
MTVEYCGQDEYNVSSFHTSTTHMSLINDKFCCNVLATRGVGQSHPVESIVQEVKELVVQGYKEVTLFGQTIDAYWKDMIPKRKVSDLLCTFGKVPSLKHLRFVTPHPWYMSLGFIDAITKTETACESLYMLFQSGASKVLAAMGHKQVQKAKNILIHTEHYERNGHNADTIALQYW